MSNYLNKILKKIEGSLIAIGLNDIKLVNTINENEKIIECNLLDCLVDESLDNSKVKKIRLGKLRKKFKKNKPNYIIYNIDKIGDYKEKFVYDTIYLAQNDIYIYSDSNQEFENIIRRYKRFGDIELIDIKDNKLYKFKMTKKINKINEKYNKLKDNIIDFIDTISNVLS